MQTDQVTCLSNGTSQNHTSQTYPFCNTAVCAATQAYNTLETISLKNQTIWTNASNIKDSLKALQTTEAGSMETADMTAT